MGGDEVSVGSGLDAAMKRAEELQAASTRRLRVRFMTQHADDRTGLAVVATIAARTGPELEAQQGKGVRRIAWSELDARAGELIGLVEEAVSEVENAVRSAPSASPRPSQGEAEFDSESYEALIDMTYQALTEAARPLAGQARSTLSAGAVAEAIAVGAVRVAALAAMGGRIEVADMQESLRDAMRDLRERAVRRLDQPEQIH